MALSPGHPEFALRTILPCRVRTFLSGVNRSDHAPTPNCASSEVAEIQNTVYSFGPATTQCGTVICVILQAVGDRAYADKMGSPASLRLLKACCISVVG